MLQESFSDVRNHFGKIISRVETENEIIEITKHGKSCALLVPCDTFLSQTGFAKKLSSWLEDENNDDLDEDVFKDIRSKNDGRDFSW